MEDPRQIPSAALKEPVTPKDETSRGHSAQHESLRKDIPKKDVAEALEDFDGDEA